jgi:hypothetical protein
LSGVFHFLSFTGGGGGGGGGGDKGGFTSDDLIGGIGQLISASGKFGGGGWLDGCFF